jgi:hypothetical protein
MIMSKFILRITSVTLLTMIVVACSKPAQNTVGEKIISCTEKQTIKRAEYDTTISRLLSRKALGSYSLIPDDEIVFYKLYSQILVTLFEDNLKACVIESDGQISTMSWTQKSLDNEIKVLEKLTQMLLDKLEKSEDNPQGNILGSTGLNSGNSYAPPTDLHTGLKTVTALEEFVSNRFSKSTNESKVILELQQPYISGDTGSQSQENIHQKALDHYAKNFSKIRPLVIDFLIKMVTNYTTPSANIKFAIEDKKFEPVLNYFKEKYNKDLSKVVVIEAPIATIPHTKGSFAEQTVGLFISPVAIPIKIEVRLPLNDLDSSLDKNSYVKGFLLINIEDQLAILKESLKYYFKSEMLFHLDPVTITKHGVGEIGLEAVVAHELRHLVDFWNCQSNPTDICDQEVLNQDWERVKQEGINKQNENFQSYLNHSDTRQTKIELQQLISRYRPNKNSSEREDWANSIQRKYFNQVYPKYPSYFSMNEQQGYKESLSYLMANGMNKKQSIELCLKIATGPTFPITMDGNQERISSPGLPWAENLFQSLMD